YTTATDIILRRQHALTDNSDHAEKRVVFNPDPESGKLWSTSVSAPRSIEHLTPVTNIHPRRSGLPRSINSPRSGTSYSQRPTTPSHPRPSRTHYATSPARP